jgi:UDP-N-acetylmuramyl tripeptide synthase
MISYTSRADAVWERLSKGDITCMSAVPSLLSNMMRVYEEKLCHLPVAKLQTYTSAVGNLRSVKCTGGLMSTSVKKFWCHILNRTTLETNYAGTEIGGVGLGSQLSDEDTMNVGSFEVLAL